MMPVTTMVRRHLLSGMSNRGVDLHPGIIVEDQRDPHLLPLMQRRLQIDQHYM